MINLGYLMANKLDAFAFFLAIGAIMKCFSDNMAIVLTVCLIATAFAMSHKVTEGFSEGDASLKKESEKEPKDKKKKSQLVYKTPSEQNIVHPQDPSLLNNDASAITPVDKQTNSNSGADNEADEPWDVASGFQPMQGKSKLDYSETVKQSYINLNKFLDPEAIASLTKDTTELMDQQTQLYSSMKAMTPLLGQAKGFLKDFDMSEVKKVLSSK